MISSSEMGKTPRHEPRFYDKARLLGKRAGIPPVQAEDFQHDHADHRERSRSQVSGYLSGLRQRFAEDGYSPDETRHWFPEHPELADLNYLGKGLLGKAPGITIPESSTESSQDRQARERRSQMYKLGLFARFNHGRHLRFTIDELPANDTAYDAFRSRLPRLFDEYSHDEPQA